MTFEGTFRANPDAHGHGHDVDAAHEHEAPHGHDDHHHAPAGGAAPAHESPLVMLVPLFVLAFGAIFAGWMFAPYFIGELAAPFWRDAIVLPHGGHHHFPDWVIWAPLAVTITGFVFACFFYLWNQGLGARIAAAGGPIHAFLYNKWFFDQIYDFVFVKGARAIGDIFWKVGDQKVIDGAGPNGIAAATRFGARQLRKLQTGFVYHYSFLMLAAAVAFGAYALWAGAHAAGAAP